MSCEHCYGYGRRSVCPICTEDEIKHESKQLIEAREELLYLRLCEARGEQIDQIELANLLDDIKELEDE